MNTFDTIGIAATGDFLLDLSGNFVLFSGIDQVSQDCWLAAQCFKNDIYFEQDTGIPYFEDVLGGNPPDSLIAHEYIKVLNDVAGVADVVVTEIVKKDRVLKPKFTITALNSETVAF